DVADDDHGARLWAERGSIERAQIVGREGLDRLGAATRWRAIAVLDAEDDARERRRRDRRRIVAALQEARQTLLAQPFQFVLWERRPQSHIRHDGQGLR